MAFHTNEEILETLWRIVAEHYNQTVDHCAYYWVSPDDEAELTPVCITAHMLEYFGYALRVESEDDSLNYKDFEFLKPEHFAGPVFECSEEARSFLSIVQQNQDMAHSWTAAITDALEAIPQFGLRPSSPEQLLLF